jgi:hypothetical protein
MPRDRRSWDGRTVHLTRTNPQYDRREIDLALTENTARDLALALRRMQQTSMMPPDSVQEICDAIDYVLVGDPASQKAHARMEAGKGMTPDGGGANVPLPVNPASHRFVDLGDVEDDKVPLADHEFVSHEHPNNPGVFRCGYARSQTDASGPCWRKREEHPNGKA